MTPTDNDLLTSVANGGANAPRDLANGAGALLYSSRTGRTRRLSRTSMSYRGVAIDVEYSTNNCIGPDACVEQVVTVEVAGADVTPLFDEDQLGDLAERIEQGWDVEAQS